MRGYRGSHDRSKRQRITKRIIRTKQNHKVRCKLKYIREGFLRNIFTNKKIEKKKKSEGLFGSCFRNLFVFENTKNTILVLTRSKFTMFSKTVFNNSFQKSNQTSSLG